MKKKIFVVLGGIIILFLLLNGNNKKTDKPNGESQNTQSRQTYQPSSRPLPKGGRILGIDANETDSVDYNTAFALAKEAGVQAVSLSLNWDSFETEPEKYGLEPNYLQIANLYYPPRDTSLNLSIRPVDTNGKRLPADLKGKKLSDPVVIERFNKFLDYALETLKDTGLNFLAVGNEIDIPFGGNAQEWEEYGVFLKEAANHVHKIKPGLPVGAVITLNGLNENRQEQSKKIGQLSDIVITTYYPMTETAVKNSGEVEKEVENLLKNYPDRPIYFAEAGMPTTSLLGSSQEKQAQFIKTMFQIWDKNISRIKLVSFSWLNDISESQSRNFEKYYGSSDPKFLGFLQTLGLMDREGKAKKGYDALKAEAKARGW